MMYKIYKKFCRKTKQKSDHFKNRKFTGEKKQAMQKYGNSL